jgi:hypothetical protein
VRVGDIAVLVHDDTLLCKHKREGKWLFVANLIFQIYLIVRNLKNLMDQINTPKENKAGKTEH